MRRWTNSLRIGVLLTVVLLSAAGCLANDNPFTSAAFPTPQAPLFSGAGFQSGSLISDGPDGEFTLVAFERMVHEGGNQSDINIDLSRSPQPVERYLFVIDRSRHSVTVLNADAQDIPEDLGDIHVRLTVELNDPVAFAGYVTPDTTVFRFAVQYVPGFVRIVDVMTQTDALLELTNLTEGTQSTLIQTQLAGLRATLDVDVLDLENDEEDDPLEQEVGAISREDKPQQPLSLGESSAGGSVNVVVRLEEEAPPVAVLPPPTDKVTQPEPDDEPPPPSDSQQPPPQPSEPPPANDGQNDDNSSGDNDTPSDNQTQNDTATPQPTDPDGEEKVPVKGGDPTEPFLDIVVIIDDTSNMLRDDPHNERLEAVRALLKAAAIGDRVGLVRFYGGAATDIYTLPLTQITGANTSIRRILEDLDTVPDAAQLTPTHLGLLAACDELSQNGRIENRMAILISDGATNVGIDYASGFFENVEQCFLDKGWNLYTVGIGQYNEKLLGALAEATGGEFLPVPRSEMVFLVCDLMSIRADFAGGEEAICLDRDVFAGQTISDISINVPSAQMWASFSLNWVGDDSDVELRLIRPNGEVVAGRVFGAEDVSFDGGTRNRKTMEVYGVERPEAGTWKVRIIPKVVPDEGLLVVFGFNSMPVR